MRVSGSVTFKAVKLVAIAVFSYLVAAFAMRLADFVLLDFQLVLIYTIGIGTALLVLVLRHPKPVRIAIGLGIVLSIAVFGLMPDSRRNFLQDLRGIRPGTTEAGVRTIMQPYIIYSSGKGDYSTPVYSDPVWVRRHAQELRHQNLPLFPSKSFPNETLLTYRHATNSDEYGADFGIIALRNGKVVRVEFSPD